MRAVYTICFLFILLLPVSFVTAGILSIKGRMVVKVVDDKQTPVESARVTGSFRNYPSNTEIECITDKEGICIIEGAASNEGSIQVKKEGFYYSSLHFEFEKENRVSGRYEPWGETYQVVLKKKRNPVPMYAKRFKQIKVPLLDMPVGFDLQIGDWVTPYGKGKVRDFLIKYHRTSTGKDWFNKVEITFSNEFDGIQEFVFDNNDNSSFRWPFLAPSDGYQSKLVKEKSFIINKGSQTNINNKVNYIFRVRTQSDERGNIKKYIIGKVLGDFDIGGQMIAFTYYFNPDGTSNLEFDPEKNLFNFSRKEKRKHRVQRP